MLDVTHGVEEEIAQSRSCNSPICPRLLYVRLPVLSRHGQGEHFAARMARMWGCAASLPCQYPHLSPRLGQGKFPLGRGKGLQTRDCRIGVYVLFFAWIGTALGFHRTGRRLLRTMPNTAACRRARCDCFPPANHHLHLRPLFLGEIPLVPP